MSNFMSISLIESLPQICNDSIIILYFGDKNTFPTQHNVKTGLIKKERISFTNIIYVTTAEVTHDRFIDYNSFD